MIYRMHRKQNNMLGQLEILAQRLGVQVMYEKILDDGPKQGAMGTWRGQKLILVDSRLPDDERIEVLRRELQRLDLDEIYMTPALREFLLERKG